MLDEETQLLMSTEDDLPDSNETPVDHELQLLAPKSDRENPVSYRKCIMDLLPTDAMRKK